MSGDANVRVGLRSVAIAIALAAVIDPSITSRRSTRPDIAVVASDSARDAALADEVARAVSKNYSVTRGTLAGAGATIVAGRTLPPDAIDPSTPVFAVLPRTDRPTVTIEALHVPTSAPALSRVRIDATVRVTGARGKTAGVALRDAAVSLDHTTRTIATDDDTMHVALSFVPSGAAPTPLHIVAHLDGASDAVGDALVDVREQKWAVLFYDPRPSWMSTFVRRAIERDPRFVATSRVVTSRDVNTSTGNPPGRLDDLSAFALFDVVVVGAPQALSANDIAGLEAFMRHRGGSVIELLDESDPAPLARLTGVHNWMSFAGNQLMSSVMVGNDSLALQSTNRVSPSALPTGAEPIAGGAEAVVWREPIGAGTLVVSGALDAWRFRDPAISSFDRFWQTVLGDAADRAAEPLTMTASSAVAAPGEKLDVTATLRDEAIDGDSRDAGPLHVRATVGAAPDSGTAMHFWPRAVGQLAGGVRAPAAPGLYHVALAVGGRRATLPFIVARDPRRIAPAAEARLVDWVRATHGAVVPSSQLSRLPSLLASAIRIEPRAVTWHPMRSAWSILPFVLALSGEWWLRRRRGLP